MTNPLAGNRGPGAGNTQRFRNTLANNASKQGYQAPVSSASAVGYGDQLANARYQYLQQLAALKSQRAQVGQQYGLGIAQAKQDAIGGMLNAESQALDTGMVGSSIDYQNRAQVIAQKQLAKTQAEMARAQGVMGIQQQRMGAQGAYYNQVGSIQNAMAQEQMANTIMAFQQDQFDAMQQNYQDIYKGFLDALRSQKRGDAPRRRVGTATVNGHNEAVGWQMDYGDPRDPRNPYVRNRGGRPAHGVSGGR